MIKVAFQDIMTDVFKVVEIKDLEEEIALCDGDDDFNTALNFDRPLVITELVSDDDLITFARYYTFLLEESVSIISSADFNSDELREIKKSYVKCFDRLNDAISNMKYDVNLYGEDVEEVEREYDVSYSTIEDLRNWEKMMRANDDDWLFASE